MRIGMFSNAYKPVVSGVVRSIDLYRQGLQQAGHFVGLFAPEGRDHEDTEPFIFRYPALPLPSGLDYTFPVLAAPQITWLLPRLKLDVIHSHHPFIVGGEAVGFSRSLSIPLVFTFHTMYHEYTHYLGLDIDIVKQIIRRVIGEYARKADRIIVPSTFVRDLLPSYHIDRPVDILPTPVDISRFAPASRPLFSDPDHIQLIYVGRVAKEKNLDFLLHAFSGAAQADARLHLRIVGGGPELGHLKTLAAGLRLGDRVQFTGMMPFKQIPQALSKADLFVFPSLTETQGLVILEAMAAGLPVVMIACEAFLDFTHSGIDCLATAEDESAFAAAILALAHDPGRAKTMGVAARKNAENYSVPSLTNRLLDIYQNTIDTYHRTTSQ